MKKFFLAVLSLLFFGLMPSFSALAEEDKHCSFGIRYMSPYGNTVIYIDYQYSGGDLVFDFVGNQYVVRSGCMSVFKSGSLVCYVDGGWVNTSGLGNSFWFTYGVPSYAEISSFDCNCNVSFFGGVLDGVFLANTNIPDSPFLSIINDSENVSYRRDVFRMLDTCNRVYMVDFRTFDGSVATAYCFLKPDTDVSVSSTGNALTGITYSLPFDYRVYVKDGKVTSFSDVPGYQIFHKPKEIGAYLLTGATFDIDVSSVMPGASIPIYAYPANPGHNTPVDNIYPTAEEYFRSLPPEAKMYTDCIILQQLDDDAYTNDVVFYCWDEPADKRDDIYLILRYTDSLVFAVEVKDGHGMPLSKGLKGYYDMSSRQWVVDSSVHISQTKNNTYSVPEVYYCSTNLYRQKIYNDAHTDYQTELIPGNGSDDCLFMYSESEHYEDDPFMGDNYAEEYSGLFGGLTKLFRSLFVPSQSFMREKTKKVFGKFAFYQDVIGTVQVFYQFLTKTDFDEAPRISVDLSAADSKYDYGVSAYALDMSWYAPYRPAINTLLSAFLYLRFIWGVFMSLPSIIHGVGSVRYAGTDISGKGD